MTDDTRPDLQEIMELVAPRPMCQPATEADIRDMNMAARLPTDLARLYAHDGAFYRPGFELFPPDIYCDVNANRTGFDLLRDMIYFADDGGDGFYFCDPDDVLGLGADAIGWVDRSNLHPDAIVPVGDDLAAVLLRLSRDEDIARGKTLSERALDRLRQRFATGLPNTVIARPPADPQDIFKAWPERGITITFATADILGLANGLHWPASGRTIYGIDKITMAENNSLAVVGHDPDLGTLAVTRGDFVNLPADRLLAIPTLNEPSNYKILGRMADVIGFWIDQHQQEQTP
ncbi:SMI1/KNR4 family protein [Octadecabacter sp. G9-8]|uniref:SMI1/KNR4 family protein n=1 Tax=Octadecabacter dasysiphoniae TaxID=2909341 RepID=A0ABS9D2A5_9RHOB|nr:SMI1/KNR4 family protein [Octadecabacter dasysiphoniae]MCF2872551.1 SMI1/KNR4 family protein [Octadecabacter dasysiphoniae]